MSIHTALAPPRFLWRMLILFPTFMGASLVCAAQSSVGAGASPTPAARLGRAGSLLYLSATGDVSAATPANVPLRKPDSLDRPGLYVWKSADGAWDIALVGSSDTMAFSGEVTSSAPINIDPELNDGDVLQSANPNRVRFDFVAVGNVSRIARFRTNADSIDFDVHVNGSDETTLVFVGSSKLNPARTSFQIAEQASEGGPGQAEPHRQIGSPFAMDSGAGNGSGPGQVRPPP